MNPFQRISHFKSISSFHLIFTVKFLSVPTMVWDQKDLAGSPRGSLDAMNMVTTILVVVTTILLVVTTPVGLGTFSTPRAAEEASGRSVWVRVTARR